MKSAAAGDFRSGNGRWFGWVLVGVAAISMTQPWTALGCAACYGESDSPLAAGMNWGIFSLLACIGGVLGGVAAFFVFLSRRAARTNSAAAAQFDEEHIAEPDFMRRNEPPHPALLDRRRHCANAAAVGCGSPPVAKRRH
jgi:hypothetical protein